eukprot:COSAG02_NODE_2238_length_9414_cov_5.054321_6_plen_885_part_01
MPKMNSPPGARQRCPTHRSSGTGYTRLASDEDAQCGGVSRNAVLSEGEPEGEPEPEPEPEPETETEAETETASAAAPAAAADAHARDDDLRTELRDRFHMASAGLDGRLIQSEWLQLCDELQMLLGDEQQTEPELNEHAYAYFDEKTRERDDATLTEEDFLEWWQQQSDATRQHLGTVLKRERLRTKESSDAARGHKTLSHPANTLDTAGLTSEGLIGREVGAQLTEQMMELRGISGFEQAESVTTALWDMSKDATTSAVSCCARSWKWTVEVLPTLPGRFWVWLLEPVPISEEISIVDWWKVFVLHLLSYCCPPLVFWSFSRKVTPGVVLTETQSYTVEFLYRSYWLGASTTIPIMWYQGELPTLVKSEVWINICMYVFLAVMNSHEEANLSKVRTHQRTIKKSNGSVAAGSVNFSEELSSYMEFVGLAAEIELHTRATGRLGTTGQRLTELESLSIRDPRFDSFDEFNFSRDFQNEITEARSGKMFADFSVKFTELIVMLGRQVSWYNEQFESVANPDPADPFCREKKKQYMSCLIKMKQSDIARLRLVGKLEEASRLETSLTNLKLLHRDIATCDDLMHQLEQLGHQDRNIILRVLPFMSIGLFLLLYVGNFAKVLQSTVTDIQVELSHDDFEMSDVGDALDEWHCALYCYVARVFSFVFLFTSFMMLMKWALKQLMKVLRFMLSRCCKKCDQDWIERQLQREAVALQDQLDQMLGPASLSPHDEAQIWNQRRALVFLGMDEHGNDAHKTLLGGAAPEQQFATKCRCCQARQSACPLDPNLPLCDTCCQRRREGVRSALKLTESPKEFVKRIQGSEDHKPSLFERFCTVKGRQAALLSKKVATPRKGNQLQEGNPDGVEKDFLPLQNIVDSWCLMLATYQIW